MQDETIDTTKLIKIFQELQATTVQLTQRKLYYASRFCSEVLVSLGERLEAVAPTQSASVSSSAPPSGGDLERFIGHYGEFMNIEKFPPQSSQLPSASAAASYLHQSDDRGHPSHVHFATILSRLEASSSLSHVVHSSPPSSPSSSISSISSISSTSSISSISSTFPSIDHDPHLLWLAGVLSLKLGRVHRALEAFLLALRLSPFHWACWVEVADIVCRHLPPLSPSSSPSSPSSPLLPLYMPTDALRGMAAALQWDSLLARMVQSHLCLLCGRFDESLGILGHLASAYLGPRSPQLMQWTAEALVFSGRHAEGLEAFQALRREHPCRLEGVDSHATALFYLTKSLGRDAGELSCLAQEVLQLNPAAAERFYVVGLYLATKGHLQSAIVHFDRATKINPAYASAWFFMGVAYLLLNGEKGKAADAFPLDCFLRVTRLNPYHRNAWQHLAENYMPRLKHFAEYYQRRSNQLNSTHQNLFI